MMMTSKPKFNSYYGTKNDVVTESGSPIVKEYELEIDDYGVERLKEIGETDFHAFIQSHKDSVDFHMIIERAQMGDTSALDKVNGFYEDVSALQMSMSEFMNLHNRGKRVFDELPTEVKQAFNNSYMEFVQHPEKFQELYPSVGTDTDGIGAEINNTEDVKADD